MSAKQLFLSRDKISFVHYFIYALRRHGTILFSTLEQIFLSILNDPNRR